VPEATSLPGVAEAEPSELFGFKECQHLFRQRLTAPLLRLFPQLTGLRLHLLWHRPSDFPAPGEVLVLCPRVRQRTGAISRRLKCCEFCLQQRWQPARSPSRRGRRFIGLCGATNFYARLQVDKVCLLTLVLHARVASLNAEAQRVAENRQEKELSAPFCASLRLCVDSSQPAGESVSPAAFGHAVALARLVLHDLEATAQARLDRRGLDSALRRLNATQSAAARLRTDPHPPLPGLPASTVQPGLGFRARKLVEAMLDFVHHHYHRPIGLDDLASAMRMNASYLSSVFSQTTGATFHHFLEEVRHSKAKELLRDPRNRTGEVAYATGYASPDAFRHAFKAHEGLSPEAWRAGQ